MSDIRHNIIKARRVQLELEQSELADLLGISRQHFNRIENGRCNPSVALLLAICKRLKIRSTDVLKTNLPAPDEELIS